MSTAKSQATFLALALCRDAFGNILMGQEERGMGYLKLATQMLDAYQATTTRPGDLKAASALKKKIAGLEDSLDALPPLDTTLVNGAMQRWSERGVSGQGVLVSIDPRSMDPMSNSIKM